MKLGFIGMGAMGSAIASGALQAGFIKAADLFFTDGAPGKNRLATEFGATQLADNAKLLEEVDAVLIAVKPKHIGSVLAEVKPLLGNKLLISIAGGVPLANLEGGLGDGARVVRVMPNINALVGASMSAICGGSEATEADRKLALDLFGAIGHAIELEETLFGAFTALAGCAPAWAFTFVEALAKAGVAAGLTKTQAVESATQMLLGSALMLQDGLSKGQHPGQLVDAVSSPGGSTIAGLLAGEDAGFSAAVVRMVEGAMAQDAKAAKS